MLQILALYLDFGGAKNIHVLKVLIWGLGGRWRFLTGVWHQDLDLYMVTGLWYTHDPNFGSLSWFWRCKEHPCPLSPHLGLWRMLEVPDWGLASWSWFGYGQEPCLDLPWSFDHTQISESSDTVSLEWVQFRTSLAQLSQISEKLSLDSFKIKPNLANFGSEKFSCKIWVWVFFSQKSF